MLLYYFFFMFDDNEIKYIKDVFDFVNENKEDAICFDDMKKGIIALGGEINKKEEEKLKKENKFNFDDFVNICKQKQINLNNLTNKLLSAFKLLETNKLGYVNKKEIENLLMNNNINEKEINLLINECNPDENGNINYEELTEQMINSNEL